MLIVGCRMTGVRCANSRNTVV